MRHIPSEAGSAAAGTEEREDGITDVWPGGGCHSERMGPGGGVSLRKQRARAALGVLCVRCSGHTMPWGFPGGLRRAAEVLGAECGLRAIVLFEEHAGVGRSRIRGWEEGGGWQRRRGRRRSRDTGAGGLTSAPWGPDKEAGVRVPEGRGQRSALRLEDWSAKEAAAASRG